LPDVPECTRAELMAMERETTGLYISGHPMDDYRERAKAAGAVKLGAILSDFERPEGPESFRDGQSVTVAGVVSAWRKRATKNGSEMCNITLEDGTGAIEALAFQRALSEGGSYISDNAALLIRGRISARDEKEPQIMADSLRPLTDVSGAPTQAKRQPEEKREQRLYLRMKSTDTALVHRIELILQMFEGRSPLVIYFEDTGKRLGARCLIHPALISELKELCGEDNVVLK
ncbi:MAG: OB-fold nucleic acid binding domain-containing protein, partial [Oscillospiraceae bacterium]|nr:OB-fold nucleic acid binding domain-containing protein [Oscillospiraceae bacterium]